MGPLKSKLSEQLHASSTDFASLLSSISLVNSVMPLLGFLVPKYGPSAMGMIATGVICMGTIGVLLSDQIEWLNGMVRHVLRL